MTQSSMPLSAAGSQGAFDTFSIVPNCQMALVGEQTSVARTTFFDHLIEAASRVALDGSSLSPVLAPRSMSNSAPTNYVVRRDQAGRPIVWRIGGMTRKITYLANGKIKTFEDTGKLSPLAASSGSTVYLLGFETHDFGDTYIGRLMVSQEVDSLVMTDLYLKNDGTVVVTDDSGFEMSWNPNNGDASTEFAEHNRKRETWTDHLDGTVTIKTVLENGTTIELNGSYELEFCATQITVKSNGGTIHLQASGSEKVCRTTLDSQGRSDVKIITMDICKLTRALMRSDALYIDWSKDRACGTLAILEGEDCSLLTVDDDEQALSGTGRDYLAECH